MIVAKCYMIHQLIGHNLDSGAVKPPASQTPFVDRGKKNEKKITDDNRLKAKKKNHFNIWFHCPCD